MTKTNIWALLATGAFVACASWILCRRFYGVMVAIPATVSITLWVMAVVCVLLAIKVNRAKADDAHGIGLDRTQLNPLTIAQFLLVGKASAWTGTIVGAGYGGLALYIIPQVGELSAAAADAPGVIASVVGGAAMAIAGLVLEHQCQVPPTSDGAQAIE